MTEDEISNLLDLSSNLRPLSEIAIPKHRSLEEVKESSPGVYRTYPVQVHGRPLAVFPYPKEIPAIIQNFIAWTHSTPRVHPILYACDFFLNFAHIHPFGGKY